MLHRVLQPVLRVAAVSDTPACSFGCKQLQPTVHHANCLRCICLHSDRTRAPEVRSTRPHCFTRSTWVGVEGPEMQFEMRKLWPRWVPVPRLPFGIRALRLLF